MAVLTASLKLLQQKLEDNRAYFIEDPLNLRYFTGAPIDTGYLVVTKSKAVFITDFRYIEVAKNHFCDTDVEVVMQNKLQNDVATIVAENGVDFLEIEANYQHISRMSFFEKCCNNVIADGGLDRTVDELRMIKSSTELASIKKAQKLTDGAFTHILQHIKPGVSERDIALEIEFYMRKNGAEGVSFDLIAITGKKTSLPHGVPSENAVENGDFFTMDIGCKVDGYCSDMTRTVAVGFVDDEMRKVYDTVLQAQKAAFEMIKSGAICSDVDKAARDVIYNAGYEGCFGHATGHSVGLFIHESPTFGNRCETPLKEGMVMTVEPGIYLENRFGVRIEDMVHITKDGFENLTHSDKSLIIL